MEFISDIHLHAQEPDTARAWTDYLRSTRASALFILGDLFEVWVGDDVLLDPGSFEAWCVRALRQLSARCAVFVVRGNRDFLLGGVFAEASGARLLEDPSVLDLCGERWLLTHGDALCLDDSAYQCFRAQVRTTEWQQQFLAQDLTTRRQQAQAIRNESETHKQTMKACMDLDAPAVACWLNDHRCNHMIHGHTHLAAVHGVPRGPQRVVLGDWNPHAVPPTAVAWRISVDTCSATMTAGAFNALTTPPG